MERYLTTHYDEEINELLNSPEELLHVKVSISLIHLARNEPALYKALLHSPNQQLAKWDRALYEAQKMLVEGNLFLEPGFKIKHNCHVRFGNMPSSSVPDPRQNERKSKSPYPNLDQIGRLVKVSGSVIRMTQNPKFVEFKREYVCKRCKHEFEVEALYEEKYVFNAPWSCPNARETGCKGVPQPKNDQPVPDYCRIYQEVRLQEVMSHRNVPASILVTLENDLVDSCQPGDRITVVGTVELRCGPGVVGKQTELTITVNANSVAKEGNSMSIGKDIDDLCFVRAEWSATVDEIGELAARDLLVQSMCPDVHGMYPVKLAMALSLASCSERDLSNTATSRGHSHLLLVGDPGLAKSRLLRFAADVSVRSVFTTGMGCSAAGLTAAAVKEDGEWQLEAGALVSADGGVCCIDEFNLMRETDKASIHEAMEQQTISIAKAGIRATLAARCAVMAATNPKVPFSVSELECGGANLGIGGPLLSRFDLVMVLRDQYDRQWFLDVADHILSLSVVDSAKERFQQIPPDCCWDVDTLQRHFQAIKDIDPELSDGAICILSAYYLVCRANPTRSQHRTTPRLMESLRRLAKAHARLLFRSVVSPVDAITVVRLMESTFEMGKILKPMDVIREKLPLGPNPEQIADILGKLPLESAVGNVAVDLGDPAKLEQFRLKLAGKKRVKVANKWETLSSQRMAQFDEEVLAKLDESSQNVEPVEPKLTVNDLYSKFSFTQHKKNSAKRVKNNEPEKQQVPQDGIGSDQLDSILGGLRENFSTDSQTSPGGRKGKRAESFHTQLDISSFLSDDEQEPTVSTVAIGSMDKPAEDDSDEVSRYRFVLPKRNPPTAQPKPVLDDQMDFSSLLEDDDFPVISEDKPPAKAAAPVVREDEEDSRYRIQIPPRKTQPIPPSTRTENDPEEESRYRIRIPPRKPQSATAPPTVTNASTSGATAPPAVSNPSTYGAGGLTEDDMDDALAFLAAVDSWSASRKD